MEFVYPSDTVPVTLTGEECALDCRHCNRHYLGHMVPYGVAKRRECKSVLVSGGCDSGGEVPLVRYLYVLEELRERDVRVIAHTGLIKKENARKIAPYVDAVSFDFVGNDETVQEIYKLDKGVGDFEESFRALKGAGIRVFPHITIGLHRGKVKGETEALSRIGGNGGAPAVVFNVFIPTKGTELENCEPPQVDEVLEVLRQAKSILPGTGLYLGCMRPGGEYRKELDRAVLKGKLVERIVKPGVRVDGERLTECCIL
jgi:uncharacterized radical SAM superfamily protein